MSEISEYPPAPIDAPGVRALKLGEHPGEYRYVTGEKVEGLADSNETVEIRNATFTGLKKFYEARQELIKTRKAETNLQVDTTNTTVTLTIGEAGYRKLVGDNDITPVFTIKASAQKSKDYRDVLAYMKKQYDSAQDFAMELRTRP